MNKTAKIKAKLIKNQGKDLDCLLICLDALDWIDTDAAYKPPEAYNNKTITERWPERAHQAIAKIGELIGVDDE